MLKSHVFSPLVFWCVIAPAKTRNRPKAAGFPALQFQIGELEGLGGRGRRLVRRFDADEAPAGFDFLAGAIAEHVAIALAVGPAGKAFQA